MMMGGVLHTVGPPSHVKGEMRSILGMDRSSYKGPLGHDRRSEEISHAVRSFTRRGSQPTRRRPAGAAAPEGQLTFAVHFPLAPTLFEPAETPGLVTPFMVLYALHDALVKPLPDQPMAPSLAESWSATPDGSSTSACCALG
jgi:hypothetical protein